MVAHPTEIDKYEIVNHLGSGHFGDVYLAKDRALDADKAIKVLEIAEPQNFMKEFAEAQILNKCRHKHIVEVNEANLYEVTGALKVVIDMEFIKGGSLEDSMAKGFISATEAAKHLIDILFALEFSHHQGILHRDIKPGNIMLTDTTAKLSDFGLATSVGVKIAGSPRGYATHLAPEFFADKTTTELTDIFASGVTLFRIVNNINDWQGQIKAIKNVDDKIKKGTLISSIGYAPHVPSKIKRVINKACHPNPIKRYQSAQEMRQSIEKLTPSICWKVNTDENWVGLCCRTGAQYEICILKKRTGVNVEVKKNKRRNSNECKQFKNENEAFHYMFSYISDTTFS